MKILLLDNYDSFTYNLFYFVKQLMPKEASIDVFRNDKISLEEVEAYDKIILSPGPGVPSESGILIDLIKTYAPTKSILGVCLGEQAIAEAFGGQLINMKEVCHGEASTVQLCEPENPLFKGLTTTITAGRYHSWVVSNTQLPACLRITAQDESGLIMGLRHETYDLQGIQFHPESVLTPEGKTILKNWLAA